MQQKVELVKAKQRMDEDSYDRFDTKEGEVDLHRWGRGTDGKGSKSLMERWKENFEENRKQRRG